MTKSVRTTKESLAGGSAPGIRAMAANVAGLAFYRFSAAKSDSLLVFCIPHGLSLSSSRSKFSSVELSPVRPPEAETGENLTRYKTLNDSTIYEISSAKSLDASKESSRLMGGQFGGENARAEDEVARV